MKKRIETTKPVSLSLPLIAIPAVESSIGGNNGGADDISMEGPAGPGEISLLFLHPEKQKKPFRKGLYNAWMISFHDEKEMAYM